MSCPECRTKLSPGESNALPVRCRTQRSPEKQSHRDSSGSRSRRFPLLKICPFSEFRRHPLSGSARAWPWPHRPGSQSRAKSGVCARRTRLRACLVANNGQSPRQHKSRAKTRKVFISNKKENAPVIISPERLRKLNIPELADLRSQEAAIVFDFDLATAKQVRDSRNRFTRAFGA